MPLLNPGSSHSLNPGSCLHFPLLLPTAKATPRSRGDYSRAASVKSGAGGGGGGGGGQGADEDDEFYDDDDELEVKRQASAPT